MLDKINPLSTQRIMRWLLIAIAACVVAVSMSTRASAVSLPNTGAPAGFALTEYAEGLVAPTAAEFAPDGRLFVAQKDGTVRIVDNGQVLPDPFYVVDNVNDYVDRGLLGLSLDPDFATNGYVYLLYTYDNNPSNIAGPKTGQLIRVTATGNSASPASEVVLLGSEVGNSIQTSCLDFAVTTDCLGADSLSHAPASLRFAADGTLFVSLGDASSYDEVDMNAFRAQDLDSLAGKILHINKDGTGIASNPYFTGDPTANRSKVYASGLRNPFRLSIRESDGLIVVGDVGWNAWEEVNVVTPGANLGWPCYEANDQQNGTGDPDIGAYKNLGVCQDFYADPPSGLTFPIYFYPHPPSSAVIGGVFNETDTYPAEFAGLYFYGDYAKNQIYSLQLDASNNLVPNSHQIFASNVGGPVHFFVGPDDAIYYLAINLGAVYKIDYSTENRAPTAVLSADPNNGASPLTVNFSSSGSTDPEGDTLSYEWDFGDGSPASTEANPAHTYTADGQYTVTLTVRDTFNNAAAETTTIYAGQTAPDVTIDSPVNLSSAAAEDIITFSGSAFDAQDGQLPDTALNWQVTIQHCPLDSCHIHQVMSINGAGGTFEYPHHDKPFYVQITLSATDSTGLTTTRSVSVFPEGEPIKQALQFDGVNDYASAAAPQDFRLQEFTVETMVKALTTDDYGADVVSAGNNWSLRVNPNGNVSFSFNSNFSWQTLTATAVDVKDGLWHHIAATRTASAIKIYVDGEIVAQSENVNPIDYAYGGEVLIGKHGDGDDRFNFNGAIDEIRFWSTPRSDADIQTYHASLLPAANDNLVMYVKAEDGAGTTAIDSSPSGAHNLTLHSGTAWTSGAPLADPDGGTPEPTDPAISTLTDTFDGTVIDTATWFPYEAVQTQQDDQISITPLSTGPGYFGIISAASYSLTGESALVHVPEIATGSAETQFILQADADNLVMIGTTNGALHLRHKVAGVNSDTFLPYDPLTMQWWRIRESGGTLHLETSPDAAAWTIQRSVAAGFDTSSVAAILQAGTYEAVAAPGVARFDNFNTPPATEPDPDPEPETDNAVQLSGTTDSQLAMPAMDHAHYQHPTLSLEAWVKPAASGLYGAEVISNGNNYGLRITPDGNLRFFYHIGGFVWRDFETTGLNLLDNTWHHVAATKDASSVNLYVDGALAATFAATDDIAYTLGTGFVIGRHGDGDDNFNFTGSIDEVRVWSIARSASDIAADWQTEIAPATGLEGYWQLDEGTGSSAVDASGNGHDLELSSGAVWGTGFSL